MQLSLFGASLSETHLVRCMAEVSVATYVCTPYVHPIDFDVPAPYNFVRNGVSMFQYSLASYIDRSKNKRRGVIKERDVLPVRAPGVCFRDGLASQNSRNGVHVTSGQAVLAVWHTVSRLG